MWLKFNTSFKNNNNNKQTIAFNREQFHDFYPKYSQTHFHFHRSKGFQTPKFQSCGFSHWLLGGNSRKFLPRKYLLHNNTMRLKHFDEKRCKNYLTMLTNATIVGKRLILVEQPSLQSLMPYQTCFFPLIWEGIVQNCPKSSRTLYALSWKGLESLMLQTISQHFI